VLNYINEVALSEVIGRQSVQTLEYRGRVLVEKIFDALSEQPEKLLPEDFRDRYMTAGELNARRRVICDYIAGMTDSYATKFYERLYVPRLGNVFERL
jgi:dGTPase